MKNKIIKELSREELEIYCISLKKEIKTILTINAKKSQINEIEFLKRKIARLQFLEKIENIENIDEKENLKANAILFQMFGVNLAEKTREFLNVKARQYFVSYFYKRKLTYKKISELMRDSSPCDLKEIVHQDHSTIIHALKNFEKHSSIEKQYRSDYLIFENKMQEKH